MMPQLGKLLIVLGVVLVVVGAVFLFADRIPWLGKLPGDIIFKRGRTTVYIPIVTMLVVSLLLTLILNLFSRK
jgi:Zn-dependent protease with chaperone function